MFKALYKKSRWLHKYLSLLLILFFMWMSISGIVLNHPRVVANISVPHWLIPPSYKIKNWNRGSLIGMVYSKKQPAILYAYGKKGVWKSKDGGHTFEPMQKGLPKSLFYLKTNHLFLWEGEKPYLLAATEGGLFRAFLNDEYWQKIALPFKNEAIKKILYAHGTFFIFSESHVYKAQNFDSSPKISAIDLKRSGQQNTVTLVKLIFDLHDGRVWGVAGRLLVDFVGLILFFMSFSGFYIWFNPWRGRRREYRVKRAQPMVHKNIRFLRTMVQYHLKVGIYVALFFLILGGTAFFMRPPFLAVIANHSVKKNYYPGKLSSNIWEKKIQNALFDAKRNRILIAASDGLWQGKADFKHPFHKVRNDMPIFVMGPTYFECHDSVYWIGSFSGFYAFNPATNRSVDLMRGQEVMTFSNIRPGNWMVTGYFRLPDGDAFITDYNKGIIALNTKKPSNRFLLPQNINTHYTLSLWNYMFELHNGRIFQDLIGNFYILIAPLGAFFFLLITLTGIFDWFYIKLRRFKIAELTQNNYIGFLKLGYSNRRVKK